MWKILMFIENWLVYPILFTICFAIYYFFYIIMMFELPRDMNYVEKYKNEFHKDLSIGDVAHGLSAFLACLLIAVLLFTIFGRPMLHKLF